MTAFLAELVTPFTDYAFMARALAGGVLLSTSCAPVGVFLIQRRMSLAGDAMAHALLPGIAAGFMVAGLSLWGMALGGLVAGLVVALAAGWLARLTPQGEDATLAGLYLVALAAGVVMVAAQGARLDLTHLLFGSVLAVDRQVLGLLGVCTALTLLVIAAIWRPLVLDCLDPSFSRARGWRGPVAHSLFLGLVALNLVAGFEAMGTLMAVGLLMLPGAAARFWSRRLRGLVALAVLFGATASIVGLLISYYAATPSGPAIVLTAGALWTLSILFGPVGGLVTRLHPLLASKDRSWTVAPSSP